MMNVVNEKTPGKHKCVRKGCTTIIHGQQQVCATCRAKDAICTTPGCNKPHGGPPTTKFCPPCRAKRRGRPRNPKNPPWTEAEDALLRDVYTNYNNREIGKRCKEVFPGRPQWSIKRRAEVIGAATVRRKDPVWSAEEDAYLRECAWMTPERIGLLFRKRGYSRTVTAICVRLKRFHVREGIDSLTATGLAKLFDVDNHCVMRWIDTGLLKAERCGTTGDNHDRWHISSSAVAAFLLAHPEQYSLTRIEKTGSKDWFFELIRRAIGTNNDTKETNVQPLAHGSRLVTLAGERITLAALSNVCGRSVAELAQRIDDLGLSVEQAAFGS